MVLPEVTTLAEARDAIRDLAEEVEKLSNELAWFKRQMFGSKTEHYIPEDDTPSLFPEEESPAQPEESPPTTVSEHERKVRVTATEAGTSLGLSIPDSMVFWRGSVACLSVTFCGHSPFGLGTNW